MELDFGIGLWNWTLNSDLDLDCDNWECAQMASSHFILSQTSWKIICARLSLALLVKSCRLKWLLEKWRRTGLVKLTSGNLDSVALQPRLKCLFFLEQLEKWLNAFGCKIASGFNLVSMTNYDCFNIALWWLDSCVSSYLHRQSYLVQLHLGFSIIDPYLSIEQNITG